MKIEIINDGGHEGLGNVNFPVVVDSFTSQFFNKNHVFCEVLGSKLIEIGGDPALIDPYDVYCFHPEVEKSCNLIAPDWLTHDFLVDLSTVVYVGGGTVRSLSARNPVNPRPIGRGYKGQAAIAAYFI